MNDPKTFWNHRYSSKEFAYGIIPNIFLKESIEKFKATGKILFPAEGEGRNAVYAAKKGMEVTAFDISVEGKNKAMLLAQEEKVQIDYQVGNFLELDLNKKRFDNAALIFAHFPPHLLSTYHKQIAKLINPKGLVILEGFSKNHLPYRLANPKAGGPGNIDMLFSIERIKTDFRDFEILQLEEKETLLNEGLFHQGKGKVIRFVGRKI